MNPFVDKISDKSELTPEEKQNFKLFVERGVALDNTVTPWISPGTSKLNREAFKESPYQDVTILDMQIDQPTANATNEYIIWDWGDCIGGLEWIDAYSLQIPKVNCPYGFMGCVAWDTNGTGDRRAALDFFDEDDVYMYSRVLHRAKGMGGGYYDIIPFSLGTFIFEPSVTYPATTHHVKLAVYQTSGGVLDVLQARMAVFPMPTLRTTLSV